MKTLKFMLAAATAIGFASAMQAGQLPASTGFEKWAASSDTVVGTGYSDTGESGQSNYYWEFSGTEPTDNESRIISVDMSGETVSRPNGVGFFNGLDKTARDKVLQVSTGVDPLLRRFNDADNAITLGDGGEAQLYVDTLVKFTVTPSSDKVEAGSEDKLMIYLKEFVTTNASGVVTDCSTNLVVKGGYAYVDGNDTLQLRAQDYVVPRNVKVVDPDTWYRLTVKAIPNLENDNEETYPAFQVWVDGTLCTYEGEDVLDDAAGEIITADLSNMDTVFSLVKGSYKNDAHTFGLSAVGFAGEGYVDDLVISTFDPTKTVVDFTFYLVDADSGMDSSLQFVCNESGEAGEVTTAGGGSTSIQCFSNETITVSYALKNNFEAAWTYTPGVSVVEDEDETVITPVAGGFARLTVTENEPQVTPVVPGGSSTYDSQAAAEAALAKVEIAVPSGAVATAVTGNEAAYKSLFEAKIVNNGNGTYDVKVDFTATAAEDLAAEATTNVAVSVAAQLSEIAADATGEQTAVSVTGATPGLYYSISYGTAVDAIDTEGDRVVAPADGVLTLQTPAKAADATAGFYKVNINAVPKPVTP